MADFNAKGNNENERVKALPTLTVEGFIEIISKIHELDDITEKKIFDNMAYTAISNVGYSMVFNNNASKKQLVNSKAQLESAKSYLLWMFSDGRQSCLPANETLNKIKVAKFGNELELSDVDELLYSMQINKREISKHDSTPIKSITSVNVDAIMAKLPKTLVTKITNLAHDNIKTKNIIYETVTQEFIDVVMGAKNMPCEAELAGVATTDLRKFSDWLVNDLDKDVKYCENIANDKGSSQKDRAFFNKLGVDKFDLSQKVNNFIAQYGARPTADFTTDDAIDHGEVVNA